MLYKMNKFFMALRRVLKNIRAYKNTESKDDDYRGGGDDDDTNRFNYPLF